MPNTLKTCTVRELIELLEDYDGDMPVIFSTDYGDHSHTAQALGLRADAEEVLIEKSAYSNSGFAVSDDDEDDRDGEEGGYDKYLLIK